MRQINRSLCIDIEDSLHIFLFDERDKLQDIKSSIVHTSIQHRHFDHQLVNTLSRAKISHYV